MSIKLWSFYDCVDVENLVARHNLNKIKIILYPLDDGYEILMRINDKEESMYFTYRDSHVLDCLDYGLLPTTILSGICQAKEQYLYSNSVIVEVIDRRHSVISQPSRSVDGLMERRYLAVLRITDNNISKLTGIKSRLGDLREEQQWLYRNTAKLSSVDTDSGSPSDSEDGFSFMNTGWFQALVRKKHVSTVLHHKQKAHWNTSVDGRFHPDLLHNIHNTRLKRHVRASLHIDSWLARDETSAGARLKTSISDEMMEKVAKLLESQKQSIFKGNSSAGSGANIITSKMSECHEECIHKMIIRSPMSGCNFKLLLSRCALHNRHWGHLIVDQWEGSSTRPIRFELPGGFSQGRRLLTQLSEMLGAKMSTNTDSAAGSSSIHTSLPSTTATAVTPTSAPAACLTAPDFTVPLDHTNISPRVSLDSQTNMKLNSNNDTIWESIESIMTKNIQSGKPLYDNRDNINSSVTIFTNDGEKRKKSINKSKIKQCSLTGADLSLQMPSKNNALLKAAGMNGEQQQKQSLYSIKDLNLDDLFDA